MKPLACIKLSAYIKLLAETPSLFRQYFLGNTTMQDRVDFWVAASKDKQFQKIGLPDPQDFAFTIPFKIYGDKGPYFKNHGLQLMSVSSLYSHAGNTLKSRMLHCNYIAVRNTVQIFFFALGWVNLAHFSQNHLSSLKALTQHDLQFRPLQREQGHWIPFFIGLLTTFMKFAAEQVGLSSSSLEALAIGSTSMPCSNCPTLNI